MIKWFVRVNALKSHFWVTYIYIIIVDYKRAAAKGVRVFQDINHSDHMVGRWDERITLHSSRVLLFPTELLLSLKVNNLTFAHGMSKSFWKTCIAFSFSVPSVEKHSLVLKRVSRLDMGAYMCIASNSVPPAVSKRIQLNVDCESSAKIIIVIMPSYLNWIAVPPMMWVPDQQLQIRRGQPAKLVCYVEAHPKALTYWEHNGRMVQNGGRYTVTEHVGNPEYKVRVWLFYHSNNLQMFFPSRLAWNSTYQVYSRKISGSSGARQKIQGPRLMAQSQFMVIVNADIHIKNYFKTLLFTSVQRKSP